MGPTHRVVVSGVASPTHLLYISSYLRRLLESGPVEMVVPPGGRVDPTAPQALSLLPETPDLAVRVAAEWMVPPDSRLTYVAVGAPGLKAYARLRAANPRRRIPVVVTDEGLGTYGTWRTRRAAWAREGVAEPWRTVRSIAVTGGARALTSTRWPLYVRDGVAWQVADAVAHEFRRRVPRQADGAPARRRVVLLSQPWPELGVVTERDHLRHVERLAVQVRAAGGELAVRAHPSEPDGRYAAVEALARAVPAELDPAVVGARAVIGGPSTALLNLAAVHGVPAVRVGVPGRPDLDAEVSPAQASLLKYFVGGITPEAEVSDRLSSLAAGH